MTTQISYLINQYPKVSHSFIRREILALEAQGVRVQRIALRGWADQVVDAQDEDERTKTQYVLREGMGGVLRALLTTAISRPAAFVRALALAAKLGWRADRPWAYHFIYLAEACVIARWMDAANSSHVHAHFGTNPAMVCLLVKALSGKSYSFTVHGPEEFDKPGTLRLREKVRGATFVAAISSFGRSQLFRWSDLADWSKINIVHCGLDARYKAEPKEVVPDAGRLVCIGRLCEQKGQLLLLQALKIVVDKNYRVKLVLAGDGEMRPEIERDIALLGLQDHVEITGWISGDVVEQQLLMARAMVLPSFAEGLPVVIMEAMALARPVITTYVAGIPELVRQGESGWLVPAGDVQALAEVMMACLDAKTEDLLRMGLRGRERVLLRHNVDTEASKLAALFSAI